LSTEPRAVAAMVCAFFPKFPTHSLDNRFVQENKLVTCFAIQNRRLC
jgi:hypothetical protein